MHDLHGRRCLHNDWPIVSSRLISIIKIANLHVAHVVAMARANPLTARSCAVDDAPFASIEQFTCAHLANVLHLHPSIHCHRVESSRVESVSQSGTICHICHKDRDR